MNKNVHVILLFLLTISFTAFSQNKMLTLDDLYNSAQFYPKRVSGLRSMPNGNYYTSIQWGANGQEIIKYSYTTGDSIESLFSSSMIAENFNFNDYSLSGDESQLLLTTEVENIYRHSTREHVYVYNLKSKKGKKISTNGKQRYTSFSPDGKQVAYVRNNNLYIQNIKTGKETPVTTDGKYNHIINGATDWVYEEEFGFDKAFAWSPDNQKIAYYRFDESEVKEFNMIMYQGNLYPTDYRFKYPKAGEDNSKVTLHIFDLKSGTSQKANLPETEYIPRIKWANANQLGVQTLNRLQNELIIFLVDAKSSEAQVIYSEKSVTYVEVVNDWQFLPDSRSMLITSEKDGYNHIYQVFYRDGFEKQITKGNWDVTKVYGAMEQSEMVYFQSAQESPMQRHIYKVFLKDLTVTKLSKEAGWNDASFSSNFIFYINTHSSANTPYTYTLNTENGPVLKTLLDNKQLEEHIAQYATSTKEFITIPSSEGHEMNAWIIKPYNFDASKKYPVLISIYGGPGSQQVTDKWDYEMMWFHLLAQKGYIIVSVDNRGTGARGAAYKKSTYQQLGKLEVADYIETAKYLGKQNYVDASRIGIRGWSYGGYMSTLAISKGAEYFKTAIAVAPVTNWRYYDNIYTERYMRTPQENASGYDDNSPINYVNLIKGNYLLVHGTADDNVHFQNTAELVSALVKNNVQYDFYMYTDKNHGIYGGNTRKHLFTKFTNFILEKL